MQPFTVVIFQSDSRLSQCLVASLCNSFHSVHEVRSLDELQTSIARHRAAVAIVDMEIASLTDVEHLSHTFPEVCIVCTHRLADEAMWAAALRAGAADICPSCDTRGILRAALRSAAQARSVAA
jgi:DNA-binding NarL/FixJ family response regulator